MWSVIRLGIPYKHIEVNATVFLNKISWNSSQYVEIFQFFTASPGWANKNRANFPDLVKWKIIAGQILSVRSFHRANNHH